MKNGLREVLWNRRQEDVYVSPDQPSFARQLKKLRLDENTVIFFTSDNGDENSYYKHHLGS